MGIPRSLGYPSSSLASSVPLPSSSNNAVSVTHCLSVSFPLCHENLVQICLYFSHTQPLYHPLFHLQKSSSGLWPSVAPVWRWGWSPTAFCGHGSLALWLTAKRKKNLELELRNQRKARGGRDLWVVFGNLEREEEEMTKKERKKRGRREWGSRRRAGTRVNPHADFRSTTLFSILLVLHSKRSCEF